MRVSIELNDNAIIIHDGVQVIHESPGYIVDAVEQEWLGKEARERAYLYSNQCENKFWLHLARAETHNVKQSDLKLVMRHLASVWLHVPGQVNTVVLIVPGSFTKTGLGLLLGICRELEIPVRAMVHQAVLCPYQMGHQGQTAHVDIQLHNTSITQLQKLDEDYLAGETIFLSDMGMINLYTEVAGFIAQEFIRKTRLDPMHSAEIEQQLYDQLPVWLEDSQNNDVITCNLQNQNNDFEIMVNSSDIQDICDGISSTILNAIKSIDKNNNMVACLSNSIDAQIGFSRYVFKHGIKVRTLNNAYFSKQSFLFNEEILATDGQVYLNKQLPYTQSSDPLVNPDTHDCNYDKPDHVLYCHHAYQIKDLIMVVKNIQGDYELQNGHSDADNIVLAIQDNLTNVYVQFDPQYAIEVNDQRVQSDYKLAVGDDIKIPGCENILTLIKVKI